MGKDAHELQPCAYREALVEGQPDERPDLLRASVVPDSGYHLSSGWVSQAEALDEREHTGGVADSQCVFVSPLCGVTKKGGVTNRRWSLPMPFSWVPGEVLNKSWFKNPKEGGFLVGCWQVPSDLEGRSRSFLKEDSCLFLKINVSTWWCFTYFDGSHNNKKWSLPYINPMYDWNFIKLLWHIINNF